MKLFQNKLEVQLDKAFSLKYLEDRDAAYLEGVFEEKQERGAADAASA